MKLCDQLDTSLATSTDLQNRLLNAPLAEALALTDMHELEAE
jgi:hypothetical protein